MLGNRLVGGNRFWAGSQRGLVRGELEHLGDAGGRALAWHIGVDREHAGPRFWSRGSGHRWSLILPVACAVAERARFAASPVAAMPPSALTSSRSSRHGQGSAWPR